MIARDIPVIPPGGVNFVDVRDVAGAFRSAMEKGRSKERYLLGGPNWSFKKFFARLERLSKVKGPRVKLPEAMYTIASTTGRAPNPNTTRKSAGTMTVNFFAHGVDALKSHPDDGISQADEY